jgi:hypothetical protein
MKNEILTNPTTNFEKCLDDLGKLLWKTEKKERAQILEEIDKLTQEAMDSDEYFCNSLMDDDGNAEEKAIFHLKRLGDETSTKYKAEKQEAQKRQPKAEKKPGQSTDRGKARK